MKKLPLISVSTLVLCGLITTAQANNFDYNYAQVGYTYINDFDVDEAVTVSGSYDIAHNVNLLGDYFTSTSSDSAIADDIDVDIYGLGIGYHAAYSDKADILAEIALLNSHSKARKGSITIKNDDSGYRLAAGTRYKFKENVEIQGRIDFRNTDASTDTSFTIGSRYYFKPKFSAGLDFNTGAHNGSESITASLRWNFK